jgi:mono/diheme cytochrome c family protein
MFDHTLRAVSRAAVGTAFVLGMVACSNEMDTEQPAAPEQTAAPAPAAPAPAAAPAATANAELLARGEYLVEGIVGCGNCHNARTDDGEFIPGMEYAGNFVIEEPGLLAYAPNITPDRETGIGEWTDEEVERAIREGINRDGRVMGPPMAFPYYRGISTNDMDAIIAYLRSRPAVRNEVPASEFTIPLPPNWGPPVEEPIPDVSPDDTLAYGRYLAHNLGHCTQCHTPLVNGVEDFSRIGAGGNVYPMPFGYDWSALSANITQSEQGLAGWTDDEIKRAITEGISRDGRELLPFMAFDFYARINEADLDAIVAYVKSLPPATAEPPAAEED